MAVKELCRHGLLLIKCQEKTSTKELILRSFKRRTTAAVLAVPIRTDEELDPGPVTRSFRGPLCSVTPVPLCSVPQWILWRGQ